MKQLFDVYVLLFFIFIFNIFNELKDILLINKLFSEINILYNRLISIDKD